MTEPDDRPGSDDPENPSELMRLIGRTVPHSPHADTGRPSDEPASPEDQDADTARQAHSGPDHGENARIDGEGSTDEAAADEAAADETGDETAVDELSDPEDLADDTELEHTLEALLLVVDSPVDEASLATTLNQTSSRIRQTLNRMSLAYTAGARGIDLRRAGEGWRFYTRDRYAPYVEKLLLDGQRARLTRAALETLTVVAYRQPVTRARVSAVRGVNCDGVLRTLLTRGLVEEAGTEEQTGGTLFRTTELFLERLGLSSVQELPPLAPLLPDIDAIDDLES